MDFDEELTGSPENGVFGIPVQRDQAKVLLLPVPWEVTTSYGRGTAQGPNAILQASPQIDLFDQELRDAWKQGFFWDSQLMGLLDENTEASQAAQRVIEELESTGKLSGDGSAHLDQVNQACSKMVTSVYESSQQALQDGFVVGVVGGDHSCPEGLLQALGEKYAGDFGVLHVDAHLDLRKAYQGFTHSHASIMYNVMSSKNSPKSLVQIGIRDYSRSEFQFATQTQGVRVFYDKESKARAFAGTTWAEQCAEIIAALPDHVYVSFDIDGLSPEFCPSTGTPVPGGLSYDQAVFLLSALGKSGKKIIGFDLCEVSPAGSDDDWDANVGSRILFQLCSWAAQ